MLSTLDAVLVYDGIVCFIVLSVCSLRKQVAAIIMTQKKLTKHGCFFPPYACNHGTSKIEVCWFAARYARNGFTSCVVSKIKQGLFIIKVFLQIVYINVAMIIILL